MAKLNGGHLVAKYLKEVEGTEIVFTLSGGHTESILDGFTEYSVRTVDVRHEQAAAMMAHAWSIYTGEPGVCLVTAGPGFMNALTGVANAFLDNAPMYLTFFNSALGSLGVSEAAVPGMLGYLGDELRNPVFIDYLTAISAGAVFFGAMTYIGNAPNFMVKSIAEEAGVPMPSFFGFMLKYSLPILLPCFVIVTLVFFR